MSCSGSEGLNPVQGQVLQKDKPLHGAVVSFHPKGDDAMKTLRPTGMTKEDGTFTLTTGQQTGAPEGEYVVTIILPGEAPPKSKSKLSTEQPDTVDRLQGAYADRARSTLRVQIKKGANQLEPFRLK